MTDFKHSDCERLSPNRAAERLVDLAYVLTVGGPMELYLAGERVSVPAGRDVVLVSASESKGREVKLEFALSWSVPEPTARPGTSTDGAGTRGPLEFGRHPPAASTLDRARAAQHCQCVFTAGVPRAIGAATARSRTRLCRESGCARA